MVLPMDVRQVLGPACGVVSSNQSPVRPSSPFVTCSALNNRTEDDSSLATTLFSFFLLSRGLGNILSTPISTALQHAHRQSATDAAHTAHKSGFTVADGRYHDMIVYTGSCFAGAAVIAVVGWSLERRNQH